MRNNRIFRARRDLLRFHLGVLYQSCSRDFLCRIFIYAGMLSYIHHSHLCFFGFLYYVPISFCFLFHFLLEFVFIHKKLVSRKKKKKKK